MTTTQEQLGLTLTPGNSLNLINWLGDIFLNFDGFLSNKKIDCHIDIALSIISEHLNTHRVSIFRYYKLTQKITLTHEWVDLESGIERRKNNSGPKEEEANKVMPWLMSRIAKVSGGVPLPLPLDKSTEKDREFLKTRVAQSIVIVPLIFSGLFIGFLLFESLTENKEIQENEILINIIANIFNNLFGNIISKY